MLGIILLIQQVAGLVQAGITSARAMADAVKAGKIAIVHPSGAPIPHDQVEAETAAVIEKAGLAGDAAAARVDGRHPGQG